MPDLINGLPAHILLVHAVVILIPLASVMTLLAGVWPAARRKLGFLTPATAFIALVLVPLATSAGEWLRHRLPTSAAIRRHADLGDTLLPFAGVLFVVALAVYLLGRRADADARTADATEPAEAADAPVGTSGGSTATLARPVARTRSVPTWATAVVAALAVVVSVATTVQVVRIGDSGSKAVWSYVKDLPARQGGDGG